MKVTSLDILTVDYRSESTTPNQETLLFVNKERAVQYIKEHYPDAIDVSEETHKKYSWCEQTKLNLFFNVEIPKFDENGDWDYPVAHSFEIQDKEVIQ